MIKAAVKGLLGRKVRTTLTALAVVLGVAMVSGTFVLTDTISRAFDAIFSGSYKNTSAVITGRELVQDSASGTATVPASLLPKVKQLPDVGAASGAIFDVRGTSDVAKLIDRNGKVMGNPDTPHFGWGIDPSQPRFNPFTLEKGKWATGPGETVIDHEIARKKHLAVGDQIGVQAQGPVKQFRISGIAKLGGVGSIGGATFAIFTVPTAQALLHKEGQFDTIFLAAKQGVSDSALVRQVKPILPRSAGVKTAADQAKSDSKETKSGMKFIQYLLLAFAAIALVVGAFVIFNTLSMTLAQRVRELATLRTLGASRRQVRRSMLLEGLITGVVASVIGLVLGIALAKGLNALFVAFGIDLPRKGTVLESRTVIVSLILGIGVTMIATWSPARRATRIPPVSAVREGATLPLGRLAAHSSKVALGIFVLAVLSLGYGLFADGLSPGTVILTVLVGCLALFIAVGFIASRAVPGLVTVVGAPAQRWGGPPGRLARANSLRNPVRTARTAGALMIGLAVVTFMATFGSGLRNTWKDALREQVNADYVVTAKNGFDPIASGAGDAVARAPGVEAASSVRTDRARAFKSDVSVTGLDPATIARVYDFRWTHGSDATLRTLGLGGAIVTKPYASDHHLAVGSGFTLTTPAGTTFPVRVRGIYNPPAAKLGSPINDVSISQQAFDARFPRPKNLYTFVSVRGGPSPQAAQALQRTLAPFPEATLRTKEGWVNQAADWLNKTLNILYVLLALSVFISLFGMVNALVLAVFERTRELGMLRAVGMTRRQTRRMIRHEGVITALIGAALGLPLGILLAAIVTRAVRSADVSFSLPVLLLVIFAVFAVVAGVLAAILPARRASRLDVLAALQYE
jgi:putative ABC transport system permease protein